MSSHAIYYLKLLNIQQKKLTNEKINKHVTRGTEI